jgi:hypothetical protein
VDDDAAEYAEGDGAEADDRQLPADGPAEQVDFDPAPGVESPAEQAERRETDQRSSSSRAATMPGSALQTVSITKGTAWIDRGC